MGEFSKILSKSSAHKKREVFCNFLFWFSTAGIMIIFSAGCSLVSYYEKHYGAHFYVLFNSVFYASGLPCAFLQKNFDLYFEKKYGPKFSFEFGGVIFIAVLIICALGLAFFQGIGLLYFYTITGCFTWLAYGNSTSLAANFPRKSTTYLQMGYRSSDFIILFFLYLLNIKSTSTHLGVFFFFLTCAGYLILTLIGWIVLVENEGTIYHLSRSALDEQSSSNMRGYGSWSSTATISAENSVDSLCSDPENLIDMPTNTFPAGNQTGNQLDADLVLYTYALMIVQASSNLVGFFYSYVVPSSVGFDIAVALYFVGRLGDLLARAIASDISSKTIKQPAPILACALLRVCLAVYFFAYIFTPGFPQNDTLITLVVFAFNFARGYLTVICYEQGCTRYHSRADQSDAARKLNLAFQKANFFSVFVALYILHLAS